MSTDTPRPERVTLTDEEREVLAERLHAGLWGVNTPPNFPVGKGVCRHTTDLSEYEAQREFLRRCITYAENTGFSEVLAAREQALREEIAGQIEAKYLGPDSGRGHDGREAPDAALRNAYDEGLEMAACIARGETR